MKPSEAKKRPLGQAQKVKRKIGQSFTQARAENETIRRALDAAISRRGAGHGGVGDTPQGDGNDDDDDTSDGEDKGEGDKEGDKDEGEGELPDAIRDGNVYCCNKCGFEAVDGSCQPKLLDETQLDRGILFSPFQSFQLLYFFLREMNKDYIPTQNEVLVQDRQLSLRGTT